MAFTGKVALFVEGEPTPRLRLMEPLAAVWQHHLVRSLGLINIERIVPISKKNIVIMDRTEVSGAGIVPLDKLIARELRRAEFDVAVIAWDLQPPWDNEASTCWWEEVLALYRCLAESRDIPDEPWRRWLRARYKAICRPGGHRRRRPPPLEKGAILAMCMVPTFESILVVCEQTIRRLLGVVDGGRVGWPAWDEHRAWPEELIQLAIEAAKRVSPKPDAIKLIRGDMKNAKNEWNEYLLRNMINDERCINELRQHPIATRLVALLSDNR
jgi:hypothetical protein